MVKTRFAPSPTGYLHIGGVRTALFSWLYARHHGGQFVLRIEDTDRERSTAESIDMILRGMEWVGLNWDEGPYLQTERFDRYREVAAQMLAAGTAYHCYCSLQELEEMRNAQRAAGQNPRYDGRCRHRDTPRDGVQPVIRFRNPDNGQVVVDDLVHGRVIFENHDLDDLVIMRADGSPTYHFGVVVDDADMEITHVIRGDDHLKNTPRHLNIIEALGWPKPRYGHLSMILGEDGARLSKRHGAMNILEYRDQGYLPEALLSYLARLGWSHGDQELFGRDELIDLFDIANVNVSASRFDLQKLSWVNQQFIMKLPADDMQDGLAMQLRAAGLDPVAGPPLADVIDAYRERAVTLREMAESAWYVFRDFDAPEETAARKHLRPVVAGPLADLRQRLAGLDGWRRDLIQGAIQATADATGLGFGKLGQPLRVALCGGSVSPPIDITAELVGRERALRRMDSALEYIARRTAAAGG